MIKEKQMKVALYTRKSTEGAGRQIQSIADQIREMTVMAKRDGYSKFDYVFSEEKSGYKPDNRDEFSRMTDLIEEGKIDTIYSWNMDRISRNPKDAGLMQQFLQDGKIQSIITYSRTYRYGDNIMILAIDSATSHQSSVDLGRNVKRGMFGAANRGKTPYRAPNGYVNRRNDLNESVVVEDGDQFSMIKKMWALALTGKYSVPSIVKIANEEWGFTTRKTRNNGGVSLSISTLHSIFKNKFYAGVVKFNDEEFSGNHKPMVTLDEFNLVQELISGTPPKSKKQRYEFSYSGLIRCGECGCQVVGEPKKKINKTNNKIHKYTYYHCSFRKKEYRCSQRKYLSEKQLESAIGDELSKYEIHPEFKNWAMKALKECNESEVSERAAIRDNLSNSIKDIERKQSRMIDLLVDERISQVDYDTRASEYQSTLVNQRLQMTNLDNRADTSTKSAENLFYLLSDLKKSFMRSSKPEKRDMIRTLGSNLELIDGKLQLHAHPWVVRIAKKKKAIKKEYPTFEPTENRSIAKKDDTFEGVRLAWLTLVDSIRSDFSQ